MTARNAAPVAGRVKAVDLFAGAGGWSEACAQLGITEVGVENDRDACATRAAAGHLTVRQDVETADPARFTGWDGVIASPPCQDFSAAGKRAGRTGERGRLIDIVPRWVTAIRPRWVACEQVPEALPIWQEHAAGYRRLGYSTWAGILCAADFGVPQTRRRAILVASLDRPATPPAPTHAERPEPDLWGATLAPWVSMAEALADNRCLPPLPGLRAGSRPNAGRRAHAVSGPAPTLHFGHDAPGWQWVRPSTTVCADPRIAPPGHRDRAGGAPQFAEGTVRVTVGQAAVLQGFRPDFPWSGSKYSKFRQIGNAVPPPLAAAILAALTATNGTTPTDEVAS